MTATSLALDERPEVGADGLVSRDPPAPHPEGPATVAEALATGVCDHPEREALVWDVAHAAGARALSYAELDARVDAAAGGLAAVGVGAGSVVACSLSNRPALVEAFLATQRLGALWLGVNANLADEEVAWVLDDSGADVVLASPDRADAAGARRLLAVDPGMGADDWGDLVAAGHPAPTTAIDPHAPAAIAYTSGTTGRPKGAVHSQHNLLWPGISSRRSYPAQPGERHGSALALTVLNMLVLGPLWAYLRGTTAVLMDRTDALGFAASVRDQRINRVTLVPAMAHDLVAHPDVAPSDLATLTQTIIGAGHSPPMLRDAWEAKFGTRAIVGYGLTEAPTGVTREHLEQPMRPDGAGYPLEPVRVVVVDDDDLPVPDGETGEVCLAAVDDGPWTGSWTPMLGYLGQPEATADALRGGVLHTGDLGFLDEDGQLVLRGRRTEMVLRGGANVYPAEVERVLLDHPGVREASVLGLPDERLGEVVAAGLVAEPGPWAVADPTDLVDDVRTFCRERLAHYKVPDRMLVVDGFPRNTMGKVVKADLAHAFDPAPDDGD
ncbi:MAG: AMP-binding protein [Actinomycetota bacterium]|nr:AMP-binding protein [Actinomycetota bacterium]MEE2958307.1 AMP-binding protein [Actinomycetota bacterium]